MQAQMTRRDLLVNSTLAAVATMTTPAVGFAEQIPFTQGTAKPRFKTLPGTCDTHFHIYNDKFPAAANASLVPPNASVADYRRLRDRLGFERSVIVQPSTYGTDNACLLEGLAELGNAARGIAVVDTSVTDDELQKLGSRGVRGIRFNFGRAGATTIDMVEPLSARIADLGWHIQVHIKGDDLADHASLFSRLPVTVVFDHLGRVTQPNADRHPAFKLVSDLLAKGKAYTKISSMYQDTLVGPPTYADMGVIAKGYIKTAPERVLWGSDWPHPSPGKYGKPDDALLMDLATEWAGDDETRQKLFVDNPARLYGF
ncbi:amidohydrolase family protein [Rhizobium leguminosarum]|uniref:amidohydrolase family protein n=1 Tax=Rhizobium leguminosarum TaxID=384 RepID=UPI0013BF3495|nr:amidohydrolase family protein [Rhizobium leguminosarum]NEI03040.1 amidohydrolase family protein [Rhizobium leguminosarum]NEJ47458.1 amidohydrolase family protein [Rhizobium leguminosarum]NEJ54407.1 amidohydrolase family protein [Rhizobium leguminosarum]NEJ82522.1 amidohydrolase family protein [Rhizobium leguminosarum]